MNIVNQHGIILTPYGGYIIFNDTFLAIF